MLLARLFSYADAYRARMGVNYKQIPVNRPKAPVHSYSKDAAIRVENVFNPVYAPNSKGCTGARVRVLAIGDRIAKGVKGERIAAE
jgi:catalase